MTIDWRGVLKDIARPDADPGRPRPIEWDAYKNNVLDEWRQLLDSDPEESRVQAFLELHPAMIPGGSGDVAPNGHHGAEKGIVFREPPLTGQGPDYEPDFMWVTRSSGQVVPVCIEIEKPSKRWFNQDGTRTAHFNHATDQIDRWRAWFSRETNKAIFRSNYLLFDSYTSRDISPFFCLIYGRRSEFLPGGGHKNPEELTFKRGHLGRNDEVARTFDSLLPRSDHANSLTVTRHPDHLEVHALSPLFETTSDFGPAALKLQGIERAVERSVMMTTERKAYIKDRWKYWRDLEMQRTNQQEGRMFAGGGE